MFILVVGDPFCIFYHCRRRHRDDDDCDGGGM